MIHHITRKFLIPKLFTPTTKSLFSSSNFGDDKKSPIDPLNSATFEEEKASHIVAKNIGMNQFLNRTYSTTGLSILGALSTSYIVNSMAIASGPLAIAGIVATLVGLISTNMMKPIPYT